MIGPSPRFVMDRAQGFTLIEVLVALFVLAVGLLGLAMLQTTGLRLNSDSYSRTQATYAAYDIIDKMRAAVKGLPSNGDVVNALNNYGIPASTARSNYQACKASTCNCASTTCSSAQLATYDLGQWYEQQEKLVPGAKDAGWATIGVSGNDVTVTMRWIEQENKANPGIPLQESWVVAIYR